MANATGHPMVARRIAQLTLSGAFTQWTIQALP